MTKSHPFFTYNRDSDTFMPTPVSNGPWDANSLHGRVVIGLLAHVIEQRHGSDDFVPARLTVDMFRLPNTTTPIERHDRTRPRRQAHQGGGSRVLLRRHQHGARLLPVIAQNGKRAGQCLVAAELGRAEARRTFQSPPIPGSA